MKRSRRCATRLLLVYLPGILLPSVAVSQGAPAHASPPPTSLTTPPPLLPTPATEPPTGASGSIDELSASPDTPSPSSEREFGRVASTRGLSANSTELVRMEAITSAAPLSAADAVAAGSRIVQQIGTVALVEIPVNRLKHLAALPGIVEVRQPVDLRKAKTGLAPTAPRPAQGSTGEQALYDETGVYAQGVKIGILDLFDPNVLAQEVASGDIPAVSAGRKFCYWEGETCPFGTPGVRHGNAVAEIIIDNAPNAVLYLAEAGTVTDYRVAIDWFATNGVRIINHSAGGGFDGPGDGTGPAAAVIDYAVSKGILWINAAGNAAPDPNEPTYAGGYWRNRWSDPDNDRWMNFSGADESLSVYCGALFGLRWDDWVGAKTDYDLFVSDFNYRTRAQGPRTLLSGRNQATATSQPIEGNDLRWLCNSNPAYGPVHDTNGDRFVSLYIQRTTRTTETPAGDTLEIMVNGGWFEYSTGPGSASGAFADSRNLGAITVGALGWSGLVEYYSAQGPTNDGRTKPDLVANTCFSSIAYGYRSGSDCAESGFAGTSAAAPVVAAGAAITKKRFPTASPAQLHLALREAAIQPLTRIGADNRKGWGQLRISPVGTSYGTGRFLGGTPTRIVDTRTPSALKGVTTAGPYDADTIVKIAVPSAAIDGTAVVLNVTSVGARRAGYVQMYSTGSVFPGATSNLNVDVAGSVVSNLVVVPLTVDSSNSMLPITFYLQAGGHLVVDYVGRFAATAPFDATATGGRYRALDPFELLNTKTCTGLTTCTPFGPALPSGSMIVSAAGVMSSVGSTNGIPLGKARAALIEITALSPTTGGYVSAVPTATVPPYTVSNLNFRAGNQRTTMAIATLNSAGTFQLGHVGTTHLKVDLLGWFTNSADGGGPIGLFRPLPTIRTLDTRRNAAPPRSSGTAINVPLAQAAGPETTIDSAWVNLTMVGSAAAGSIAERDALGVGPELRVSTGTAGQVSSASTIIRTGRTGAVLTADVATHLAVDLAGWFLGTPQALPGQLTSWTQQTSATPLAEISAVEVSDDGNLVVFQTSSNEVRRWSRTDNSMSTAALSPAIGISRLSGSGRFAVGLAANPDPTSQQRGIYVIDLDTGSIELVSDGPTGTWASGVVEDQIRISDDGRFVSFITISSLVAADTDALNDLYLLDRSDDALRLVAPTVAPQSGGITDDGTKVVIMWEKATSLYPEYHVTTTTLATDTSVERIAPTNQWGYSRIIDISTDGRFISKDGIVDAMAGYYSVQRFDTTTGQDVLLNTLLDGGYLSDHVFNVPLPMSGSGDAVVVRAGPVYDITRSPDLATSSGLYVKSFVTGILSNVFLTDNGTHPAAAGVGDYTLSDNGRYVVYVSDSRTLISGSNPAAGYDVFVWDRFAAP